MTTERINKFQPDRTLYLRGFTGFGTAASLCEASPSGFKAYGVFRDQADFAVAVLYDADNTYEHYSVKYLPDFNVSGMVLNFSLTYQGLQPIDSAKYSWIDWAQLDVVPTDGVNDNAPVRINLWDYATLAGGSYTTAQGTYTILAPGGCTAGDELILFVNNVSFGFTARGGETAAQVAETLAGDINSYNWSKYENSSIAVMASTDASGSLTLTYARTGTVNVSEASVSWNNGQKFPGIPAGATIFLGGNPCLVSSLTSPTSLELTTAAADGTSIPYLAPYGGVDGNGVQVYMLVRPANAALSVNNPILQLAGGNSDNVTWNISLDFAALGINQIRQAWLTFAPQLAPGAAYTDTEWSATFSNWSVVDPNGAQALQCAGPASLRVGNGDPSCVYSGAGWGTVEANNYWRGFAHQTGLDATHAGDSVTVTYKTASTHDLYLGTSLFNNRGVVSVTLDGNVIIPALDCFLNVSSEIVTRRLLQTAVTAGTHTVTLTLLPNNHAGTDPKWDPSSLGYQFVFDYIEAAVPSDIPNAIVIYPNVSAALDFDTDATYKVSPQRLLWHMNKLGFAGQLNEYIGVYWWNQRKRVNGVWNSAIVTFSGTWMAGDSATIEIGGFKLLKAVTALDTSDTIALHFAYYINAGTVSTWAEKTGGQLTIHSRTPNWGNTLSVSANSSAGQVTYTGTLNGGADGEWQIDASAATPVNYPVTQWHADLYKAVAAAGMLITTSFSMELVNPPDDGTPANAWKARFANGTAVDTATDFSGILSSQCAPITNLTNLQKLAYTYVAGLQSAAGLTPWLQFGEFLWWYYSCQDTVPVGYAAYTAPISIGVAANHGLSTGDRVVISGVEGMTGANGTWTVTVNGPTHFTLDGSSANGAWASGTGTVWYKSMAYYDQATSAAAQAALGRPLYAFIDQDEDPTVNGSADANFLAAQLKAHVDAIRTAVLVAYPDAKFEILYPNDVNNPVCYRPANLPAQGGRLNAAVNLPAAWQTKAGSGLDRFKVEALSWGATYLNLDLALEALTFPFTGTMSWAQADVAYLIPWFNGTCPWISEYQLAASSGIGLINFWAYDHIGLMSWPVPFPSPTRRSFFAG